MNEMKKMFATVFGVVALVGLLASPVFAITYYFPLTGFEDDNIEFLVGGTDTIIDVGERLVGVAEFTKSHSIPPGSEASIPPAEELTAVFDLTVTSKTCVAGNTVCSFTFAATGAGGVLAGRPAGTAVTLYLDGVDDINLVTVNCTGLVDCVDKANNGNVFLDGLITLANPATGWTATSNSLAGNADDVAFVSGLNATQSGGTYNFCLDAGANNTGFTLLPQACGIGSAQIGGGGAIKGGQGLTNGAFGRSDNDFQLAQVPEPSTLLLLGAGLLGVNFINRRRNKK